MGTLILTDFQCVEETNEIGSDGPYFVFFIGKGSDPAAAQVVTIRQPQWDERVDKGDVFHPNATVSSVDDNTLVLCALMEEDFRTDITTGTGAFRRLQAQMRPMLAAHDASGATPVAQLAQQLIPEYRKALDANRTNDDLVDVVHVPTNIDLQQHGAFRMEGGGGSYLVWFAIG
jgi:hypothetical protein